MTDSPKISVVLTCYNLGRYLDEAVDSVLDQTFQGARHVKAYGMEAYETKRAARLIESLYALVERAQRIRSVASPLMETLGGIAVAAVIWYGGYQVITAQRSPGAFWVARWITGPSGDCSAAGACGTSHGMTTHTLKTMRK